MKILRFQTMKGPNVFHHQPVLIMDLDIGDFETRPSSEIPGFTNGLLEILPGLKKHGCSYRREGGFVDRLREGTYMAHIVEHIALELSVHSEIEVTWGKTIRGEGPSVYRVAVRYESEEGMRYLLRSAVELALAVIQGRGFDLTPVIAEARRIVYRHELGPSTRSIVEAASRRAIPWMRLDQQSLIQLGYGVNRRLIQATTTELTSTIGVEIAQDKDATKAILQQAMIPVPDGRVVRSESEAIEAFNHLNTGSRNHSVVVKPLDGNQGKGVSLNLRIAEQVAEAFRLAQKHSRSVVIEENFHGRDYRVLVVAGKVIAAAERLPAHVIGDGKHSIEELIEIENRNPLRGEGHEKPMTHLAIDEVGSLELKRQGFDAGAVPALGQFVRLRGTANLSTGGSATDVTDLIHAQTKAICERASRLLAMDVCGIDLIAEDISKPLLGQPGGIIEVNASPGIRMHLHPSSGLRREVGEAIVNHLFPPGATGRIPIVAITGTNGKTTTTRLISSILQEAGLKVGMTTTDGIWINGEKIAAGDTTGPISARGVLADPAVEVAVLETARGGIVRRGLAYDWSDIGILTNIAEDHLGQDGIEDLDDIVHIKSLVAERVREGGTLILNADDPKLMELAQSPRITKIRRELVYFSQNWESPALARHLSAGGRAYVCCENTGIFELDEGAEHFIGRATDFPITLGGKADFHIDNVLAAIAACRALGRTIEEIRHGLMNFDPAVENPGRTNFYRVGAGYFMVDYAHNPEAFRGIGRIARSFQRPTLGVIALPGDRSDESILEAGRTAAEIFDRFIIKEDQDLRGRRPGEVAELIRQGIHEVTPEKECVIERDEGLSVNRAVAEMKPGELVVVFYDKLPVVRGMLEEFGAISVSDVPAGTRQETAAFQEVI